MLFKDFESAKEFAEFKFEDLEKDEKIFVLTNGNEFVVVSNCEQVKRNDFQICIEYTRF